MTGRDAVVVGGGLAGLAASAALAEAGCAVTLLEWRPYLGGRAYSYEHPAMGEVVDSQHVVLGCCTNIVDLVAKAGAADTLRWFDDLLFLEPGGRRSVLRPSGLPAPMQRVVSLLRAPMLSFGDKLGVARGLAEFLRGYPADDRESAASWMQRTGQTERAIRHFWEPVIVATLNDSAEQCSLKYAGKVFHEAFLRSAEAGRMGIPTQPLSEFLQPIASYAERLGARVRLRSSVEALRPEGGRWTVTLGGGEAIATEAVVLATDFKQAARLTADLPGGEALTGAAAAMRVAPITTVHLWYDREFTSDDQAALLDTRVQWMFHKSRIRRWGPGRGSYLELVISGSFPELAMSREVILAEAVRELALFYPQVREARLVKSAVLKEARATFSVLPGMDAVRPAQATEWPGIFLAGDWTQTEWPATMEGAARSGRLAAGALLGDARRFVSPELPARGLMRLLSPG